nr:zinc finger protein 143 isoform X2 [Helicoverpa armigera]
METDKVCRVCLITDVKLHDLRSYPLDSYYESVIGTNHLFSHLPPYACFECAALVRKFYFFRQKCLRSQAALCAVVDQSGKAKKDQLDAIDRTSLHINSSFGIYYTAVISIPLDNDQPIKLEPVTEDFDFDTDNDKIKLEDHTYALNVGSDHIASSDDDEPLSLHKEKKSLTFTKDESVQEKIEFKEDFGELAFAVGVDDGDSGHIIEVPQVVERRKKRKLRADTNKSSKNLYKASVGPSADFEQYVNVITLTLEEQIAEIMKRKESANYLNSPYQCNLCYKGFIDNDAWNHHVSKHAVTAGSVECIVCKFRFKTKRAYQKHASNHEKKYACKSCPYVSRTPTQAKQHQGWHKGVTFECNHCGESFTIWTSYMSHVRIKHPSQHICNVCGYSFISKMGLNMHKSMMHKDPQENADQSTEAGPYCAECDVKFISTEAYKRHMVMSVKHTQSTEHITAYNRTMEKQPDEPEDFTNEPLPSKSEPMEVQDAVASTLATPFAQSIIAASKSRAQKQREYRQRIAASRTPAQAAAARKSRNERQRKYRLRQAAIRDFLEATTTSSSTKPITAAPKTRAQIQREYRQRITASKTLAQAAAANEARNIRDRNNRLRRAANLAIASGSLEATTTSSFRSGQRLNTVHIHTQQQFTD